MAQNNNQMDFQEKYLSRGQLIWRAFLKHRLGVGALVVLIVLYLMALFADFLSPYNPAEQSLRHTYSPPTKVYRTYKGQRVKAYVLPSLSYVDKITYERTYKEMLFPRRLVIEKPDGTRMTYELGKDGVESFKFSVNRVESIKVNGQWYDVKKSPAITDHFLFNYNEDVLNKGVSRFETTSAVAQEMFFKAYKDRFGLTSEYDIEAVAVTEALDSIVVRKDGKFEMIKGKVIDYDYKTYP
ncbi:MAG: ABC transporter permease, partial [Pseudothermotoga sp.]